MSNYRYILDNSKPRRKLRCPQCGRPKCFTPYIDLNGEIIFPEYVGRCDHEISCKYHYSPETYFKEHGIERRPGHFQKQRHLPVPPPVPMLTIPNNLMTATFIRYEVNPLFNFLSAIFGNDETLRLFRLYNVGTAKLMGGSTVFWQVDINGCIRTGKIMKYGNDGHRVKTDGVAKINWVHNLFRQSGCRMVQCFFGEHLLSEMPYSTVVIVESEKSALIASHFFPEYIWLASGSCSGCLNESASQVLKGREVRLLPDLGAEDKWFKKVEMLRPICRSVEILTWLTEQATERQRELGLDIADFLIEAVSPVPPAPDVLPFLPYDPNEICPF